MVAIFIFILGLLLGSFYNVVGLRLPNNESIIYPGSHCPNCNHKLSWYENIPILSYIFLGGKCKSCKKHISFIYPSMEMLTGILFLLSYLYFGISESFFIAIILSSLVVIIFVSDSKYMIILDSPLIICSVLIVIVKVIYEGLKETLFSIGYGVLIFFVVYLLMLLGNYIFKRESLGGGDIKLSFISGLVLGPWLGLFYIVLASFFAFPYAVYITISKKEGMLPFGPFLATSLLIIYFNSNFVLTFLKALVGIH
jgi:leader peptidase (prepilin peptidase) / N-methyltransferase